MKTCTFIFALLVAGFVGYITINHTSYEFAGTRGAYEVSIMLFTSIIALWMISVYSGWVSAKYTIRRFSNLKEGVVYEVISWADYDDHYNKTFVVIWLKLGLEVFPVIANYEFLDCEKEELAPNTKFTFIDQTDNEPCYQISIINK
jgi:hypothetical protein